MKLEHSGMFGDRRIIRGFTPIRPIVNAGTITETDVTPLVSGFSGASGMDYSGYSGSNYVWYSPADSGTKNGTWGPLSTNLISVDTATVSASVCDSGAAGEFSDTIAASGVQLIGGSQNILQSNANLSIDVKTVYVPPTTPPSADGGELIQLGGVTLGSGSSTSAWQILNLGDYDPNAYYILSRWGMACSSGSSTESSISVGNMVIELGDVDQNVVASINIEGSSTQTTSAGYNRSGTTTFSRSSCVIPLTYGPAVQYARMRYNWTCSTTLSWPDGYTVGGYASIIKVKPALTGYKVAYRNVGNTPAVSVTGSAIGYYSQTIPYVLPIEAGYSRFCMPIITWSSGTTTVTGNFYPPTTSMNGSTTTVNTPTFSQGNITETSGAFEIVFQNGSCSLSAYNVVEEFYHFPVELEEGDVVFERLHLSGSLSTDRTVGSSGFSSMKWQYGPIAESGGSKYTSGVLNPPLPDFTLE